MRASLESSVGRGAHGETCGDHWTRGGYPLGLTIDTIWEKLCQGVSGIGKITRFDAHEYSAQIAGEVRDFTPEHYIDKRDLRRMDRFVHYAMAASQEAIQDAGLSITESMADRVGVYIGTAFGGLESLGSRAYEHSWRKDPTASLPSFQLWCSAISRADTSRCVLGRPGQIIAVSRPVLLARTPLVKPFIRLCVMLRM